VTATLPRRPPNTRTAGHGRGAIFEFDPGSGEDRRGGSSAPRPRYPALDGLRGTAVLAVVAYHAGVPGAVGGYLGVDAFFVLSGYLITTLLIDEWEGRGAIDVAAFWGRRLRRLVPPVVVMLTGSA
jgi:peptidoglycan/LPS O-acetylase OafA/YrhL